MPPADVAAAKINLVDLLLQAGRAAEALPIATEADAVLVQAYGPTSKQVSVSRLALAETLHDLGRVAEAVSPYRYAWTVRRATLGEASAETIGVRIKYAHALVVGDPAAALALLADLDALADDLRGVALLTRAQARVALGTDLDSARDDALRARALIPASEATLRRELEALTADGPW